MSDDSVHIDKPRIEYSTDGFQSDFSIDYATVKEETNVFYEDVREEGLPITIFSQELSPLQAIVKYLRDNKEQSYSQIARTLNRDARTIWATYNQTKEKPKLKELPTNIIIPISIFYNRDLSTLEALVKHLLQSFSVNKIAELLAKDYKTIWTVKKRIQKKGGGANE